ncbi:MAG: hypothetical protein RL591_946 [Planctomycetota bacterium]
MSAFAGRPAVGMRGLGESKGFCGQLSREGVGWRQSLGGSPVERVGWTSLRRVESDDSHG